MNYDPANIIRACPKCRSKDIDRDSVDIGIGILYGPWGCINCGWSEDPAYDLSKGRDPVDEKGGVIDQFGGYHPAGSSMALGYRMAREFEKSPDGGTTNT